MSIYLSFYYHFLLPQIPPRLIKYYHVVSLCFVSLAALEFLTSFHCDFLSAISSSAQPLIDFSLEKILFFFFSFFILAAGAPSLEASEVVCDL